MLGREGGGLVHVALAIHELVPPVVSTLDPVHVLPGATHHEDGVDARAALHGLVDLRLERCRCPSPIPAVSGDHEASTGVEDPIGDGIGSEAPEDHRVGRTYPSAGQHGDHCFGDHRHVDRHAVARFDPEILERMGCLRHASEELAVGDVLGVAGRLPHPVEGHLVGHAVRNVAIEAGDACVQRAVGEPAGEGWLPLEGGGERGGPGQGTSLGGPPGLGILGRLGIDHHRGVRRLGEVPRRREVPLFTKMRFDCLSVLGAHVIPLA